jgi:DNA-binding transcriptional ArsR family regulator
MSEGSTASQPPGTQKTLHYRLTSEEWLDISQRLKFAELRVLYYLRTLDPFGDRQLDLKVIDIAEATGLSKGTTSKALRTLTDLEYIDLEMIKIRVRVKKFPVGNLFPVGNFDIPQETFESCRKLLNPVGNIQQLEPAPDIASGSPHTIQTIQTLKTLSEDEREFESLSPEFRAWLTGKAKRLPKPPEFLERWIEVQAQRPSIKEEFLKYRESRERISIPPPPPPPEENFKLSLLLHWWSKGETDRVKDWIAANPDSGLVIGESGPMEVKP